MLYDMRQVEIDTLDMRVFGSDQVNIDPKTTSNIHKPLYALKTFVAFKNLLHNYSGVVDHCSIENLIEPRVEAWILKCMRAMNPVKWNSPFPNCIFQLGPKNEYKVILLQQTKKSKSN